MICVAVVLVVVVAIVAWFVFHGGGHGSLGPVPGIAIP